MALWPYYYTEKYRKAIAWHVLNNWPFLCQFLKGYGGLWVVRIPISSQWQNPTNCGLPEADKEGAKGELWFSVKIYIYIYIYIYIFYPSTHNHQKIYVIGLCVAEFGSVTVRCIFYCYLSGPWMRMLVGTNIIFNISPNTLGATVDREYAKWKGKAW